MSGGFSSEKADILLNFVRRDPAYHIITFASDRYVNRFEPGRNNIYYLADGDADPNLASWGFLGSGTYGNSLTPVAHHKT